MAVIRELCPAESVGKGQQTESKPNAFQIRKVSLGMSSYALRGKEQVPELKHSELLPQQGPRLLQAAPTLALTLLYLCYAGCQKTGCRKCFVQTPHSYFCWKLVTWSRYYPLPSDKGAQRDSELCSLLGWFG